jgi:hypothetical protein
MLKLKHQPVSEETEEALQAIKRFIAMLAAYYSDEKEGKLKLED